MKKTLEKYMNEAMEASTEYAILIDKYIKGIEIEVDAICDGEDVLIPGIMEHVERTGIHSGDSITVYPHMTLNQEVAEKLVSYTRKIAVGLDIIGLANFQYAFDGEDVYVIEVNPRASRTVPILSKVTGVPMVKLAVDTMLGMKLKEGKYGTGLMEKKKLYAVKVPVFSNEKLVDADIYLGPEMKSTGEVLGIDAELNNAIYKGFRASGIKIPTEGTIYVSFKEVDKEEGLDLVRKYYNRGFKVSASEGTGAHLIEMGMECNILTSEETLEKISNGTINIVINTPTRGSDPERLGFKLRKKASEYRTPLFTSVDTANIFLKAIDVIEKNNKIIYKTLAEYLCV